MPLFPRMGLKVTLINSHPLFLAEFEEEIHQIGI